MNLRLKVLVTLCIAFLVIILALLAISSTVLISSYESLESTYVSHEVNLVRSNFDTRITDLYVLARDWAVWEDSYLYVTGKNPEFIRKNLQPEILAGMDLDLLIITNDQGEVVYGTGFDPATIGMRPVPEGLLREIADPASPLRNLSKERSARGFVSLPGGLMILGAHPILHSDESGPPAGMVIMGRYVDEPMIGSFGPASHETITLAPVSPGVPVISPHGPASPALPGNGEAVIVRPRNEEIVEGSMDLTDLGGNDIIRLTVRMPRDIYQQGRSTIISYLLILAAIGLIMGFMVIFLIDNLVLSRISALQRDVDSLGNEGDFSGRLILDGDDEISRLAAAINATFDHIGTVRMNLQKSEARYRTLLETSPRSIAHTDICGKILYCNHQMAVSHGYEHHEDLVGKFFTDFVAPEYRDRMLQGLTRNLKEGQTRNAEYRAVKADGSEFWAEMTISPIRNPQGDTESYIVVSSDITGRKTWEDQLRRSEERYRTVFENTGTATVIIDENTVISLANSEFIRMSGYSRSEIEGKMRWTDLVVREDLDHMLVLHRLRRADAGSAARKYEFRCRTKSGAIRDILLSVDMIPGTTMSIASLMDITDRKQAELSIIRSENKLNAIINSSPIPQFVIDRDHHVIHWNKALERLTGVAAKAVLGTDQHWKAFYESPRPCIADLVVDGGSEAIPDNYTGKYTKSEFISGMCELTSFFPRLGDTGKWLYFTSVQIRDSQGTVTGAVETLVDITERKNAEDELTRTNEQLVSAMQELRATEEIMKENIAALEEAKLTVQKSEAKYRDIATNIPGIVFQFIIHDLNDYSIPFISDRIISLFTLGPDEIYSNPNALFNLIHEEDVHFVRTSLLESARNLVVWNIEFRMKTKGDEAPRWFNGRGIPHMLDKDTILWDGMLIDITERKHAEVALLESEHKFRAIFDESSEFLGLLGVDGTLIQINHAYLEFSGITDSSEVLGKPFWETPWWSHSPEMQEQLKTAITRAGKGEFVRFEATHRHHDGSLHYVDFSLKPVLDENRSVVLLIPEGHDITERRLLEEEVRTALKEKEMLLKEIHHRVKNNIQVIASLLNMQSRAVEDPHTREVLRDAQNRVKSIALVHEKLYQSKSLDRIDYHDYLQKISRHLYESYGVSQKNITMNIRADDISLHIDKAIPCSLIINELLSNAFKHAFPSGRRGDIWIDLHKAGESLVLTYRDNGVGLPEGLLLEQSESLGMRLLYGLTHQLHGTIEVLGNEGTHITITFPFEPGREETQ